MQSGDSNFTLFCSIKPDDSYVTAMKGEREFIGHSILSLVHTRSEYLKLII